MLQNIMANDIHPPKIQRALVLQGGGSLGAYEAGVFHILYHWIKKTSKETKLKIFLILLLVPQ
jgi:hypothetical protein